MNAVANSAVMAQKKMKAVIPYDANRSLRLGDMLLTRASTETFAVHRLAI